MNQSNLNVLNLEEEKLDEKKINKNQTKPQIDHTRDRFLNRFWKSHFER